MSTDQWSGVIAGSLLVVAHLVVQQVVVASAHGVLGPNRFLGLRSDATMASAHAWEAGHRAVMVLVGGVTVVGILLAAAGIGVAFRGGSPAGIVLLLSSAAVLAVGTIAAVRRASHAAGAGGS